MKNTLLKLNTPDLYNLQLLGIVPSCSCWESFRRETSLVDVD